MDEEQPDWFVGVDWASQTHHAVIVDARGRKVAERGFAHGGEGLAELADWIGRHGRGPPERVPVATEVPHGPVVESRMERGFPVHAINPEQFDRFRDRFSPAGAKDDRREERGDGRGRPPVRSPVVPVVRLPVPVVPVVRAGGPAAPSW